VLDRSSTLPNGLRVRVRLPHGTDRPGLRALHERAGVAVDDLELTRLLRVDPRHRCAVVATTWVGASETIVGFALCELPFAGEARIVADDGFGPELGDLLHAALRRRASRVA
jgi:hypothetical protein